MIFSERVMMLNEYANDMDVNNHVYANILHCNWSHMLNLKNDKCSFLNDLFFKKKYLYKTQIVFLLFLGECISVVKNTGI